jgi:hypothetical protein
MQSALQTHIVRRLGGGPSRLKRARAQAVPASAPSSLAVNSSIIFVESDAFDGCLRFTSPTMTATSVLISEMTKTLIRAGLIGQQGVNLLEARVLSMGFLWSPTGKLEAGIDGYIELRNPISGEALGCVVAAQSKATAGRFDRETDTSFDFVCTEADLTYWLKGNLPILLVVSRPASGEAYWVSIKDYFSTHAVRQTRRVSFNKITDKFDESAAEALLKLGVHRQMGVYFSPSKRTEMLTANLIEVAHYSEKIYLGNTPHTTRGGVREELMRLTHARVGREWTVIGGQILSFHDLSEFPWSKICDPGTVEPLDTSYWADSHDGVLKSQFVRLLNCALREKLAPDIRLSDEHHIYYFSPTWDLKPRHIRYKSKVNATGRTVFGPYYSHKDPGLITYYRHSAFEGYFERFGGRWYLAVTPTYHFTRDGREPDPYRSERLFKIKQLERNPAVFGQLRMWAEYLTRPPDFFTPDYAFLRFGTLKEFALDYGVDDDTWLRNDETGDASNQQEAGTLL